MVQTLSGPASLEHFACICFIWPFLKGDSESQYIDQTDIFAFVLVIKYIPIPDPDATWSLDGRADEEQ
jgi:hypothetical protein